jgi:hypothetical protein
MRTTTARWPWSTVSYNVMADHCLHLPSPAFLVGYLSACLDIFVTVHVSIRCLPHEQAIVHDPPCALVRHDIHQEQQCRRQRYR